MILWSVYSVLVAGLLGWAAAAGEAVLRDRGGSGRWLWAGALGGSIALPVAAWLWPASGAGAAGGAGGVAALLPGPVVELPALVVGAVPEAGADWERLLVGLWAAVSAVLMVALLGMVWKLNRARRGWVEREVDGCRVLVSRDTGPAVVGVVRGEVVIPGWALGLEGRLRRLMLLHEREHLAGRDPWLLLAGLLVVVALPWNPAVWWLLRRLRLAVELDCDGRVLRLEPDRATYGALLLEVGRRRSVGWLPGVSLTEPRTFLERRIRIMANGRKVLGRRRGLGLAVAGSLALATACLVPEPGTLVSEARGGALAQRLERPSGIEVRERAAAPVAAVTAVEAGAAGATAPSASPAWQEPALTELPALAGTLPVVAADTPVIGTLRSQGPVFTPYTVRPELRNRAAVMAALERHYPRLLRDAGVGGTIDMWFLLDEAGEVVETRLKKGSGVEELDEAALQVAETMRFSPALNGDVRVPVWIALPIIFRSAAGRNIDEAAGLGRLTGVVADASGRPLGGVQIVLKELGRGTLTQDNGRYFLINIPPGVYTLVARTPDGGEVEAVVEIGGGVTGALDIRM
jgi:TonB family protein